jgi:serine/threonine protein kinase
LALTVFAGYYIAIDRHMPCLADDEILAFLQGSMPRLQATQVEAHVDACADCRSLLAEAAKYFFQQQPHAVGAARSVAPSQASTIDESAAEEAAPSVPMGSQVGRYVVTGLSGSGGMGTVYVAHDPDLHRKVALKLLRSDVPSKTELGDSHERLLREARAMARLSHPNVVALHDVGTWNGQVFLAMEHIEGTTLRRWLGECTTRRWQQVVEIFLAAGKGLAAAHHRGLVHRDFKPENVLIDQDGRVRVTDFGLARPTADGGAAGTASGEDGLPTTDPGSWGPTTLTKTGAVVGTPKYMAPEQFLGKPTDPRTDQFSFCVALYEGLYRERPFAGESLDELANTVVAGRVRAAASGASVPTWLRAIVLRGLNPSAEKRYPSMDELLAALAERVETATPLPSHARRGRKLLIGLSTLGVVAVSVAIIRQLRAPEPAAIATGPVPAPAPVPPAGPPSAQPRGASAAAPTAPPAVRQPGPRARIEHHARAKRHALSKKEATVPAPTPAPAPVALDRYGNNLKNPFRPR